MQYGYIRVSTESQTTENQKLEIEKFISRRGFDSDITWVAETISGTKKPEKRKLGELLKELKQGDLIIITELSRLGRSLTMILNVLQIIMDKKAALFSIKEGYELGDNLQSKVIAFAFGLSAEVERTLISERTKQGLARVRKEGKRIGRQKGEIIYGVKLRKYQDEIMAKRKGGRSIYSLSKEYNVTWSTMKKFVCYYSKMKKPKKHKQS